MIERFRRWLWFRFNSGAYSRWRPKRTERMKSRGTVWALFSDGPNSEWRPVCDFCGGNCGQCGLTGDVGNVPFNFERMIRNANV